MQQTARTRTGWADGEKELMWREIRSANEEGLTLKRAFHAISEKTGRKPNSVRNFYYQSLKEQGAPEELRGLRPRTFVPFDDKEVQELLRAILIDKAKGISVRACVQRLGGGDRALALRYQNKYRSILKSRPELIEHTLAQLSEEGIECPNPCEDLRARKEAAGKQTALPQADAQQLIDALRSLIEQGEVRSRMRHREEIDRMMVRCDLLRLELARREEWMLKKDEQFDALRDRALALAETCDELLGEGDIRKANDLLRERIDQVKEGCGALEAQ